MLSVSVWLALSCVRVAVRSPRISASTTSVVWGAVTFARESPTVNALQRQSRSQGSVSILKRFAGE